MGAQAGRRRGALCMDEAAEDQRLASSCFRKVAWRSLPLLGLGYLFAYMDRVNIGFAAAQMNADLGFSAAVYGMGGGLFFLSYALMEVPSNLLMQRFGARLWIGRIMLTWGVLAAATMFVRTPWQFYAMRLLLGAAEAGFFPAVIVYLSYWFPLERRSRALSLFYVAFPLSSVVMGALAGSLLNLNGLFHLHGWQWLLLAEGLPAALLSVAIFAWLPDRPENVDWLSAEEKSWLQARLAVHPESGDDENPPAIVEVLTHPRVLWLGLVNALFLGTGYAFTLTAPQVLGLRTGLSLTSVGYLVSLGGLVGAAAMLGTAWLSDRRREQFLPLIGALIVCGASFLVLTLGTAPPAAMAGYLGYVVGGNAFNAVFMVLVSRVLRPQALVVGCAGVNMIGQLGSFVLPTAYGLIQQQAGHLDAALPSLAPPFFIAAAIIAWLRISVSRRRTPLATLAAE
jgi:ACS family tartrate transporter-like MFS transporter